MANTGPNGLPMASGIELVSTKRLPDRLQSIFPFPFFNAMQSKCFSSIYHNTTDNFVLSAPTGSGKTAILELAICSFITNASIADTQQFKIIYQAPTKALCAERQRDWSRKFGPAGLKCQELTGDTEQSQLRHVQSASIIITTPEKWDSITRRWQDHRRLMDLVKLFLIDEVHILKDDRGASLEAVVSRMKTAGRNVRFIALSATVPNSEDIAAWLGKSHKAPHLPALREVFGEQFRPVRLEKRILGLQSTASSEWQFEAVCNTKLPQVIADYSIRKPIMIFCFTRKATLDTAQALAHWWQSSERCERLWDVPGRVPFVSDPTLNECLQAGVAFHNAGLDTKDRSNVEDAYLKGYISVLCCTSTLAVGVNLPCHLVIIKNTVTYQTETGSCKEYSDLDIMQMVGRAGRPQFDDSATAVIMTRPEKVQRYERMVQGEERLESRLHLNLIEHLNAEICLGTVSSIETACDWLEGTFLAIRLSKNPQHYKIEGDTPTAGLQERVRRICSRDVDKLTRYDLARGEGSLRATEFGDAMARYYVHFDTMKLVMGLQHKAKMSEILSAIAQSSEFRSLRFKAGEKQMFKDINSSPLMKYPIKVHLDLPAHKVSLIIQAALSGIDMSHDGRYKALRRQFYLDTALALQHAKRLIRCIIDCKVEAKDSVAVRNTLELARSLGAQAWDDSPHQLSQLEGIGPVAVRKLVSYNIRTLEDLELANPLKVDMALSKNPPFGANLLQKLRFFPKLRLSLKAVGKPYSSQSGGIELKVKAEVGFLNEQVPTSWKRMPVYVHLLAETSDGHLVHFARASATSIGAGKDLDFTAPLEEANQMINCYVACDDIAGTLKYASLDPKIPAALLRTMLSIAISRRDAGALIGALAGASAVKDEFDDEGLDDNDLEAAAQNEQPQQFLNIDDLLSDDDHDSLSKSVLSGQGVQRRPLGGLAASTRGKNVAPGKKPSKPKQQGQKSDRALLNSKAAFDANWQPERLPTGKWKCLHACKNRDICKHACCKNGIDNKPRGPPKIRNEEGEYEQSTIMKNFLHRNRSSPDDGQNEPPLLECEALRDGHVKHKSKTSIEETLTSSTVRLNTSSTLYGDDPFNDGDDLKDLYDATTSNHLPTTQAPSAYRLFPQKGRSLFLNNTSSPEKMDAELKEDSLDDVPLAKRRRTSNGRIATLGDIEAEASGQSMFAFGLADMGSSPLRGGRQHTGLESTPKARDATTQLRGKSSMDDYDLAMFDDEPARILDDDGDSRQTPHASSLSQTLHFTNRKDATLSGSNPYTRRHDMRDQSTACASGVTSSASTASIDHGRRPSDMTAGSCDNLVLEPTDAPHPSVEQPEADQRTSDEEDAIAWVLKEFGDYVEVV